MVDIADMIKRDLSKKDDARKSNRERMPNVAALVDQMEAEFGKLRVLWCKEGDIEIGKRFDWSKEW